MYNKKGINSKVWKRILYCLYLFFIVFVLLEIVLRIYNPLQLRIKGDKIILPVNQVITIKNSINPRLDPVIVNKRNSIGLRGPEPPANFDSVLSVVTVGGSTTECFFLNDDSTWPARLGKLLSKDLNNVWVNNAGLSGHSTFGHQVLLDDHLLKIKPKVILFLTGINDVENDGPSFHDKLNTKGAYPDFVHYIYNNSEVLNVVVNLFRGLRAQKINNTTDEWRPPMQNHELNIDPAKAREELEKQKKYLNNYGKRIEALADTCINHGILPVFITQPWLYGEGIDSVTHVDLSSYNTGNGRNGRLYWDILQLYNQEVKTICGKKQIPVIDLASKMPKNSLYYYDGTHYTNEGAGKIAHLVAEDLLRILHRIPAKH